MNTCEKIVVPEEDREKIITEISQCQARVIQTLVPTILALASIICFLILLIIALSILLIYFYRDLFRKRWHKIKMELEKQEASKKGYTDADLKIL